MSQKKVEAFVRPGKLNDVKIAAVNAGVIGMTISRIRGLARQKDRVERYRGVKQNLTLPWVRVEMIVDEEQLDLLIQNVSEAAQTGQIGDGKIAVSPIENVIRIRTKEEGVDAL